MFGYKDSWHDDREDNNPITTEITFQEDKGNTKLQLYSSFATEKQRESILNSLVFNLSKPCSRSFLLATSGKILVFLDILLTEYL